jgi:aminoglycoside phosphotransferase (APT) family kinase protein
MTMIMSEKSSGPLSMTKAASFVKAIGEHYLGRGILSVTPLSGSNSNYVFELDHAAGSFVVRLSPNLTKLRDYNKETIVQERVRRLGIPAPELLHVGIDPVPFEFSRKIKGQPAAAFSAQNLIIEELGAFARLIHSIPTFGHGSMFSFEIEGGEKSCTWIDFLEKEWQAPRRLEILIQDEMLTSAQGGRAEALLEEMERWTGRPALNHGDLRLKNVLVNEKGKIVALLDWERCVSAIPPYWDLSIALHDLSIDAKEAFLRGYGMTPDRMEMIAPFLKLINLLNYATEVEAADKASDREELLRLKTRIGGRLDLYSLS